MVIYVYEIGKISAEPHGAAEIVPTGIAYSGAGIPPVVTYCNIKLKDKNILNRGDWTIMLTMEPKPLPQDEKANMVPSVF